MLSPEQLVLIREMNNIPVGGRCGHGCVETCWLASKVTSRINFDEDFTMPPDYEGCDNFPTVQMILDKIVEISNTSTTE